jgi:hypothetical protein
MRRRSEMPSARKMLLGVVSSPPRYPITQLCRVTYRLIGSRTTRRSNSQSISLLLLLLLLPAPPNSTTVTTTVSLAHRRAGNPAVSNQVLDLPLQRTPKRQHCHANVHCPCQLCARTHRKIQPCLHCSCTAALRSCGQLGWQTLHAHAHAKYPCPRHPAADMYRLTIHTLNQDAVGSRLDATRMQGVAPIIAGRQ